MADKSQREKVIELVNSMGSVGGLDAESVIGLLDFVPGKEELFLIALSTAKIATQAREISNNMTADYENLLVEMEALGFLKR